MKKLFIIILCTLPFAGSAQGFLKRLKDKAVEAGANMVVDKSQQIASKKIDKAVNGTTDQATDADKNDKAVIGHNNSAPIVAPVNKLKAYSRYDYVPGQAVFYAENFAGQNIGELAVGWNSNGNGQVVTIDGIAGNWLKMNQHAVYLSANKTAAGKDFTLEFDLVSEFKNGSYLLPSMHFGMLAAGKRAVSDNSFLKEQRGDKTLDILLRPGFDRGSAVVIDGYQGRELFFDGPHQEDFTIENYGKPMHVAMSIQNRRVRLWLNANKVFDIPAAIPDEGSFNQFYFSIEGSNYKNEDINVFLSNLKLANGVADTRSKLLDEGKYSTTGILFDTNTATLKPASYGVLNEIATILKDNPSLKLKITGHTDSDGNADFNKQLSLNRADAVKEAFVNQYQIDSSRLDTQGLGATQPVGDNKTATGKAQNRRVEFSKQ